MELGDFKDWLFDVLNEQNNDIIVDIDTNENRTHSSWIWSVAAGLK